MLWEYLGAWSSTTKLLLHLNWNANDSSWNWNNWTPTNITWVGWKIGSWSASFNGSNSLINLPLNIINWTSFTFSGFIKPAVTSGRAYYIRALYNPVDSPEIRIYINNNSIYFAIYDWWAYQCEYWIPYTDTINFHHICWACRTNSFKLYIDWIEKLSDTSWSFNINWVSLHSIWYYGINGSTEYQKFNWLIDEVIIENRAWTPEEVRKYYTYSQWRFIL